MGRFVAASRYLAFIAVVFGVAAAVAAFGWGSFKTVKVIVHLVHADTDGMAVALVQIMDAFLIASGLLIFALGMFELFVGELPLPKWLVIRDLDDLKRKIIGVVILVMAVSFLERLETREDPRDILYSGVAVAAVIGALVWFGKSHG